MPDQEIRVGLIGAGRNTRERHIPGFNKVDGLEIAAVANRSRESGRVVADQFNIPTVYDHWQELLEDPSINAICIGTWPNMHRTLTVAALEAGKHVLCEARMAANASDARAMLSASRAKPDLVTQIVPSPTTFKVDPLLQKLIGEGYLGELLSVELQSLGADFVNPSGPMHWRFDRDLSGYNVLNMGIWYEAMIRWVGRATRVMASYPLLQKLIGEGYLGELLSVELQSLGADFVNPSGPMHWRFDRDLSGYNVLNMGIWYEAMIRWVGRATRVMAMTKVNVPYRQDDDGNRVSVTIPDHADILCELANGAQAHMRFSTAAGHSTGNEVWLYGSEGTIRVDHRFSVYGGKRGDPGLSEIENPESMQASWRVEEEFANAIRGTETITRTPFDVGVHYMEWTEAVTRSAQTGKAVSLPL